VIPTLSARRNGRVPRAFWAGAAALTVSFLFGSSGALAAAPPANSTIGNQATASYVDPTGATQLATSNQVLTTVAQVGSFALDGNTTDPTLTGGTLTVVNAKTGAAGTTVYAPHVLTNTGNGADTFSLSVAAPASPNGFATVAVYADANGDGQPDSTTSLCSVTPANTCDVSGLTVAGGASFPFVVAYTIPGTATTTNFTSPVATKITAKPSPALASLYASTNQVAADADNVNLTTSAAFNGSKSLSVPAVSWVGGAAWPAASVSGPRSSSASCPTTASGLATAGAGCYYTTYTLTFNNTGGAAGKFVMTDTLPSGFTYVQGSAVWSNAPGTALGDASGAGNDPTGIDYAFDSANKALTFVVNSLPQNATQTVSFVVLINNTAAIGTSTTTNTAKYSPVDAPTATSTVPGTTPTSTNNSSFNVTGTYSVVLGSTTGTTTTAKDTTAGTPNSGTADNTTVATAVSGTMVKFPQLVFNTGNATDTVNLSTDLSGFPAGSTVSYYAADGVTPLGDTNGDTIKDTGPIAPGGSVQVVAVVTLPSLSTVPATPTAPYTAIVKGTSVGDATKSDTTGDILTKIVTVLVDLTNTTTGSNDPNKGDIGTGPSVQPTTTSSTPAGTGVVFPLYIRNNDDVSRDYNLSASQTNSFPGTLPAGWTVTFVQSTTSCSATAVSFPLTVTAGQQASIGACVTPPTSQAPVTGQPIYFQVKATTATAAGITAVDTKLDAVTVTTANTFGATLTPNNNGQVAPGGSVVYPHTLSITGAQSCGSTYKVVATLPAADVSAGWSVSVYVDTDNDGQLSAGDTVVPATGIVTPASALTSGQTQKLFVKVFAPGGATAGATDTANVVVTFPSVAACGSPSATDISTVITGQIRLVKTQALDSACTATSTTGLTFSTAPLTAKPGECIVYRVVASNEGAAPVTNMTINDAVPGHTTLTGATQPTVRCESTGITPTTFTTAANFTPSTIVSSTSTVACGSTTNTVAPGGTATLTFKVRVADPN